MENTLKDDINLEKIHNMLPSDFSLDCLRRWHILPIDITAESVLIVAVPSYDHLNYAESIGAELGYPVEIVIKPLSEIDSLIARLYDFRSSTAKETVEDLEHFDEDLDLDLGREDILTDQVDAPIIRLVNSLIVQALRERASDIHIEPQENEVIIRFRIDGVLHERLRLPKNYQAPLITRIKVMARMDIAERFIPQDGRIGITLGGKEIDIRVGLVPTQFGQRLALRLLDKEKGLLSLEELGMEEHELEILNKMIRKPYGMILFTGPTGSGKTTTLYAILQALAKPEVNVITIEDPIEYSIPGIGQIQVNEKAGITFASGLRAILRQDPDIVMVGEMRDTETARIGVQAALTGHLVLSTLHTNDAPSAIARLVDMGVEPYLVASCLIGVVAQRLVRRVCKGCRVKVEAPPVAKRFGLSEVFVGKGCSNCFGTGYSGRLGLYEQLLCDEQLQEVISKDPSVSTIRKVAIKKGMRTLFDVGLEKVKKGITTIDEVLRVTGG